MVEILDMALGRDRTPRKQPECSSEMPHILMIAAYFFMRADTLARDTTVLGRAMAIAQLVGYVEI